MTQGYGNTQREVPVVATPVAAEPVADDSAKQTYLVCGETVEVDDGQGGTTTIDRAFEEPFTADELLPGQRGYLV